MANPPTYYGGGYIVSSGSSSVTHGDKIPALETKINNLEAQITDIRFRTTTIRVSQEQQMQLLMDLVLCAVGLSLGFTEPQLRNFKARVESEINSDWDIGVKYAHMTTIAYQVRQIRG